MKKQFRYYSIVWAIALVIYNVLLFAVRPHIPGAEDASGAGFWLPWVLTMAAFVGQLLCAWIAFSSRSRETLFLNIPVFTISRSALIATALICGVLALVPVCPAWNSAAVAVLILGFSAIAVVQARAAAEAVGETEAKIASQTQFLRGLTAEASALLSRTNTEPGRAAAKQVYETLRYSDPVSAPALQGIEQEIEEEFHAFSRRIASGEKAGPEKLIALIQERNEQCRRGKNGA